MVIKAICKKEKKSRYVTFLVSVNVFIFVNLENYYKIMKIKFMQKKI